MPPLLDPSELNRLERLALATRRGVGGSYAGVHRSKARGRSQDFADWREYQPGDDPRSIDMAAWARLDQVLVRLYEADINLALYVLVDTSASMNFGDKHRQAVRVGVALSALGLFNNETVAAGRLSDRLLERYSGRSGLARLLSVAQQWSPEGPTPLLDRAKSLLAVPRRVGLIVVVSDFLTPDWQPAINKLIARGDSLLCLCVRSDADDNPELFGELQLVDSETAEHVDLDISTAVLEGFSRARATRRDAIERFVVSRGGAFVVVNDDDDLLGDVLASLMSRETIR